MRCLPVIQPIILKELKHLDTDFTEEQKIELNTVRQQCVCSEEP